MGIGGFGQRRIEVAGLAFWIAFSPLWVTGRACHSVLPVLRSRCDGASDEVERIVESGLAARDAVSIGRLSDSADWGSLF